MYKKIKAPKSTMKINESYTGETLEQKIERIVTTKEPINETAPLIYTERKDGVQPQYDIRTDRFEIALEAMNKVTQTHQAQRENRAKTIAEQAKENMAKEKANEINLGTENNPGPGANTSDK